LSRPVIHSFPTRRSSDLWTCSHTPLRASKPPQLPLKIVDRPQAQKASQFIQRLSHFRQQLRIGQIFLAELLPIVSPHPGGQPFRSEEHTSELQSRENLVC